MARKAINPWVIAMTVMLATFMEVLDTSVANVALPHIAGNLSASIDETTWMLTSYLVSNAIILPMGGWFSMLMGRKRFYMICVALFTVASLLCGMAPTLDALIFFRVLQGLGGGALQPISQAILVESFPREKHGMAMAVFGMGVVVAPIIGPTLGGWLTDDYSWRWIFFINLPVGLLSLFAHRLADLRSRLTSSAAAWATASASITPASACSPWASAPSKWCSTKARRMTGLPPTSSWPSPSSPPSAWWPWSSGNCSTKHPIIDFRILKERNYALATVSMLVLGFVLYGSTALLPMFLQTMLGYTAMLSGLVLSPGGLAVLVLMPVVGTLLRHYQPRWLVIFGVASPPPGLYPCPSSICRSITAPRSAAASCKAVAWRSCSSPSARPLSGAFPRSAPTTPPACSTWPATSAAAPASPPSTTMLARRAQFHQSVLVAHLTPYDCNYRDSIARTAWLLQSRGASAPDALQQANGLLYANVQRQSSMLAFGDAFWLMAVLFLAIVPLMFLMKPPARKEI